MSGFVYIWFDRKHKRYYIGSHWGSEDDGYICSSTWMRNSFKRRTKDFRRRILSKVYTTREDLLDEEFYWLSMIKPEEIKVRYYNLAIRRINNWSSNEDNRISIGRKISKSLRGNTFYNPSKWKKGQSSSPETQFFKGMVPHNKGKTLEETNPDTFKEIKEKQRLKKLGKSPANKGVKGRLMFINDGTRCRQISKTDPIPDGWSKGMGSLYVTHPLKKST